MSCLFSFPPNSFAAFPCFGFLVSKVLGLFEFLFFAVAAAFLPVPFSFATHLCGGGTHASSQVSKTGGGYLAGERRWRRGDSEAEKGLLRLRGSCLPWKRLVCASLLALELPTCPCLPGRCLHGLACPGGEVSDQVQLSCLPWRRALMSSLLAREENGPCVFACPRGEGRCLAEALLALERGLLAIVLLAREETTDLGPRERPLACPGRAVVETSRGLPPPLFGSYGVLLPRQRASC